MKLNLSLSVSPCARQAQMAERELAAFFAAVADTLGPVQARLSAEAWLEEAELMGFAPPLDVRDWRAVTVAASARLAERLNQLAVRHRSQLSSTVQYSPEDSWQRPSQ